MTNIGIIADTGSGGNFLRWSIYFLAGYDVKQNPLTKTNAHAAGSHALDTTSKYNNWVSNLSTDKMNVAYITTFQDVNYKNFHTKYHEETARHISKLQDIITKTILLSATEDQKLYHCRRNLRVFGRKFGSTKNHTNYDEHHIDYINTFFNESYRKFEDNVWDYREFLALSHNPYNFLSILPNVKLAKDYYTLDLFELFEKFDIKNLFGYLKLDLHNDRYDKWKTIYNEWQKIHAPNVRFAKDYQKIISNILSNNQQDLVTYNLDIMQEAAILHSLIFKHNLNLKNWQLEKFESTEQLHKLLEPSFHKTEKIEKCSGYIKTKR